MTDLLITGYCRIKDQYITLNGDKLPLPEKADHFQEFIRMIYKQYLASYPKFFKMDNLSKLGYCCAGLLLEKTYNLEKYGKERIAIMASNRSASLDTDLAHQQTITDPSNYFPSPAVFVYTLPNIVIGEIAIRHKIQGENIFFVSEEFDAKTLHRYAKMLLETNSTDAVILGWFEIMGDKWDALCCVVEKVKILEKPDGFHIPLTIESLDHIYSSTNT
ncbi:MAG: 3-oxoacyl-ACP synthase [Bacteroidetes bacterium]|nr:3-oxoacyl-ACP synthase [Bacteroidota bacterium]